MWIKLHDTMLNHIKIKRLSRSLGLSPVHARGHIITLWLNVLVYASDGDLDGWDNEDIADYAEWTGDANQFVEAMAEAGLLDDIDGHFYVHDWMEYAESLKIAQRRRDYRARNKDKNDVSQDSHDTVTTVDVTGPSERRGEERRGEEKRGSKNKIGANIPDIILKDGSYFTPTEKDIQGWIKAYANIDVIKELYAIQQWNLARPKQRKTKSGIKGHIVHWLNKGNTENHKEPRDNTKHGFLKADKEVKDSGYVTI